MSERSLSEQLIGKIFQLKNEDGSDGKVIKVTEGRVEQQRARRPRGKTPEERLYQRAGMKPRTQG